jgi:hypothetical protein
MKLPVLILSAMALFSAPVFAAEQIVIDPITPAKGKVATGVKKSEQVTVSGPLQIVPMGGAMMTIQSSNYGQLILFSPWEIDVSAEKRLRELESSHAIVKVTGRLNTVCSEKELRSEVMGCRRFDMTKVIVIEKP